MLRWVGGCRGRGGWRWQYTGDELLLQILSPLFLYLSLFLSLAHCVWARATDTHHTHHIKTNQQNKLGYYYKLSARFIYMRQEDLWLLSEFYGNKFMFYADWITWSAAADLIKHRNCNFTLTSVPVSKLPKRRSEGPIHWFHRSTFTGRGTGRGGFSIEVPLPSYRGQKFKT